MAQQPQANGPRGRLVRNLAALALLALPVRGLLAATLVLPNLDQAELDWLGARIFHNECASQRDCLTAWNPGEDFPSLGIGHFIWYRADQEEIFRESFPALLSFLREHGAQPPAWLASDEPAAPWPDREAFLAAYDGPELSALRDFLATHVDLQTAFIVQRFQASSEALLDDLRPAEAASLRQRLLAVAHERPPQGLYALIDYVHFKGDGLASSERYAGQGWGLLQVLRAMPDQEEAEPLQAFVAAAREVLAARVRNAPPARNEARWLEGWHRRVQGYLTAP